MAKKRITAIIIITNKKQKENVSPDMMMME